MEGSYCRTEPRDGHPRHTSPIRRWRHDRCRRSALAVKRWARRPYLQAWLYRRTRNVSHVVCNRVVIVLVRSSLFLSKPCPLSCRPLSTGPVGKAEPMAFFFWRLTAPFFCFWATRHRNIKRTNCGQIKAQYKKLSKFKPLQFLSHVKAFEGQG